MAETTWHDGMEERQLGLVLSSFVRNGRPRDQGISCPSRTAFSSPAERLQHCPRHVS